VSDWSDGELEFHICAIAEDGHIVDDFWLPAADGVDTENVEWAIRRMFGEPLRVAFEVHPLVGRVEVGWDFHGGQLARFDLPTDGTIMRVVPTFVKADGSNQPVGIVMALPTRTMQDLLDEASAKVSEAESEGSPVSPTVSIISAEEFDSTDALEVIGRVLGDERLTGHRSVRLKSEMSIDLASVSIGQTGDLYITNSTRDGWSSRFEDTWKVESRFKPAILERLLTEQFPGGVPFEEPSQEVADEVLLRLIRAHLESVHRVTGWLREAGIPWEYSEQYHGGMIDRLRDT
jgi:hypothetical protein